MMNFIKADNISYSYPVYDDFSSEFEDEKKAEEKKQEDIKLALSGACLDVEPGQFICILGRNGSGKSTLARHLNALLVPSEGTVWINGRSTSEEKNVWDIRADVGMVFQNPDNQIIASVVEEDVAFGLENLGIPSDEIQSRVKDVLESVNMSEYSQKSPGNLSGGQKQRVAVAGVLAMEPECIVLDEATSMLDPKGRAEVMKTVKKLNKEKGITIIAITHYMDETLDADKVFIMHNGKVVLSGTPREIFENEEKIEEAGLMLPQLLQLAKALRKEGLEIPQGIITKDGLVKAIKAQMS